MEDWNISEGFVMPYINSEHAQRLAWGNEVPDNAGDMNYMITKLCDEYLQRKGLKYEHINAIVGALECAKLEMYRRLAAPYENQKCLENGDVYDPTLVKQADPNRSVVTPVTHSDVRLADFSGFGSRIADH
jgi:hypothetical protein